MSAPKHIQEQRKLQQEQTRREDASLKQHGYRIVEKTEWNDDVERLVVTDVFYAASDGVEMRRSQALDEIARGSEIVRAEIAAQRAEEDRKRAEFLANESAVDAQVARIENLPVAKNIDTDWKTYEFITSNKQYAIRKLETETATIWFVADKLWEHHSYYVETRANDTTTATINDDSPKTSAATLPSKERKISIKKYDGLDQSREELSAQVAVNIKQDTKYLYEFCVEIPYMRLGTPNQSIARQMLGNRRRFCWMYDDPRSADCLAEDSTHKKIVFRTRGDQRAKFVERMNRILNEAQRDPFAFFNLSDPQVEDEI